MESRTILGVVLLSLLSSSALAATYYVSPGGNNGNNGIHSPWLTIQHAIKSLPQGDNVIHLAPGTYAEGASLDLSGAPSGHLTIQSTDPAKPATITSSGPDCVIRISRGISRGALSFRNVAIVNSNTACLLHVDVQNLRLAFDHCSLRGNSSILETTAQASGVRIEFQNSRITSARQGLHIRSAAEITLSECDLAWDATAFVRGAARSNTCGRVVFDRCSLNGSPSTLLFSTVNPARYNVDLLQVSDCTGTCGRLSWERGGIRQWRVARNNIHLTYTGTVPIGAGIEVRNGQTKPVVNPAPYEEITIEHNTFRFADGATHPVFLAKGADHAKFVGNVLICPNGGKYGVVVKSDHNLFESNSIYAARNAFYLAGASHNHVRHNTIYSYKRPALLIDANQERSVPPVGTYGQSWSNVVTANILVAAAGPAFMQDAGGNDDSESWHTLCDRNVYWNMSGRVVAILNGVPVQQTNGIAGLQAAWSQYGKAGGMQTNDCNSVIADPLLSSPPADFSLKKGSPALLLGGAPNVNAGVWQGSHRAMPGR